jgi:hypothetical protein
MDGWYLGSFVYNAFKQLAEQPLLPKTAIESVHDGELISH